MRATAFAEKSATQILPLSSIHIPSVVRNWVVSFAHTSLLSTFPSTSIFMRWTAPSPKFPTKRSPASLKTIPSSPYCTSGFFVITVVIRFLSSNVLVTATSRSFISKQYTPLTNNPEGSFICDNELCVTYSFPLWIRRPLGCSIPDATVIVSFNWSFSNFRRRTRPLFCAFSAPLQPWLSQINRSPSSLKAIPIGEAQPVSSNTGTSIHFVISPFLVMRIRQAGCVISAKFGQARIKSPLGAIAIPSGVGQQSGKFANNSLFCGRAFSSLFCFGEVHWIQVAPIKEAATRDSK